MKVYNSFTSIVFLWALIASSIDVVTANQDKDSIVFGLKFGLVDDIGSPFYFCPPEVTHALADLVSEVLGEDIHFREQDFAHVDSEEDLVVHDRRTRRQLLLDDEEHSTNRNSHRSLVEAIQSVGAMVSDTIAATLFGFVDEADENNEEEHISWDEDDEGRLLARVSAGYKVHVNGTCRRCSSTTVLFSGRRRPRRNLRALVEQQVPDESPDEIADWEEIMTDELFEPIKDALIFHHPQCLEGVADMSVVRIQ